MNTFSAQILTPEGSIFDDEVTGVRVPGEMGSFEVKTLHANIISSLDIGQGARSALPIVGKFINLASSSADGPWSYDAFESPPGFVMPQDPDSAESNDTGTGRIGW